MISRHNCSDSIRIAWLHGLETVERLIQEVDLDGRTILTILDLALDFLLASADLIRLGSGVLHLGEFALKALETCRLPFLELLGDQDALVAGSLLEIREILGALLVVDVRHEVCGEVDDFLEFLGGHVQQVSESRRDALEEPDVGDRGSEFDVPHALTTDLGPRDFDATALTDHTAETHTLVLPAVALPVPRGTEDALVEQSILLRFECPVVDRFGLLDLAEGP